jgi:hypothetical protein
VKPSTESWQLLVQTCPSFWVSRLGGIRTPPLVELVNDHKPLHMKVMSSRASVAQTAVRATLVEPSKQAVQRQTPKGQGMGPASGRASL